LEDPSFPMGNSHTWHGQASPPSTPIGSSSTEPEYLGLVAYSASHGKLMLYYLLSLLTIGILPLLCHWFPQWATYLSRSKCPELYQADYLLIQGLDGRFSEVRVDRISRPASEQGSHWLICFEYRKQRYYYYESSDCFRVRMALE
jgi:hypothetical protein